MRSRIRWLLKRERLKVTGFGPERRLVARLRFEAPVARTSASASATVFQKSPGDKPRSEPKPVTFDLLRFEGQTIRLRFACVDNQGPMRAGVDDIRLVPLVQ